MHDLQESIIRLFTVSAYVFAALPPYTVSLHRSAGRIVSDRGAGEHWRCAGAGARVLEHRFDLHLANPLDSLSDPAGPGSDAGCGRPCLGDDAFRHVLRYEQRHAHHRQGTAITQYVSRTRVARLHGGAGPAIADLAGTEAIATPHVTEAMQ